MVAHVKDFRFEGNIVGDVIYKEGEIWVYMPAGSRNITIQNDKYGVLRYTFPERLKKQTAYEVQIKLVENLEKKVRTLVIRLHAGVCAKHRTLRESEIRLQQFLIQPGMRG